MRVRYVGPFEAVTIPDAGVTVERGVPFDVSDEMGASLVDQAGNFEAVADAPAKAAKPAE